MKANLKNNTHKNNNGAPNSNHLTKINKSHGSANSPSKINGRTNNLSRTNGSTNNLSRINGRTNNFSRINGTANNPNRIHGAMNNPNSKLGTAKEASKINRTTGFPNKSNTLPTNPSVSRSNISLPLLLTSTSSAPKAKLKTNREECSKMCNSNFKETPTNSHSNRNSHRQRTQDSTRSANIQTNQLSIAIVESATQLKMKLPNKTDKQTEFENKKLYIILLLLRIFNGLNKFIMFFLSHWHFDNLFIRDQSNRLAEAINSCWQDIHVIH